MPLDPLISPPPRSPHSQDCSSSSASKSLFPLDSYAGLEAQTAERVRRFEDEAKAMMKMRGAGAADGGGGGGAFSQGKQAL